MVFVTIITYISLTHQNKIVCCLPIFHFEYNTQTVRLNHTMAFKALGNTLLGNITAEKELLQNKCEALLTSCPGVGLAGSTRL